MKTSLTGALWGLPTILVGSAALIALEEPQPWGFWWSQILFFLALGVGLVELGAAWGRTEGPRE